LHICQEEQMEGEDDGGERDTNIEGRDEEIE
jgi:hypothetical protein